MRAVKVVHNDTDYLATGTHHGADGASVLWDKNAHFKSTGVTVGVVAYNDDDESYGPITAVTEETVTATLASGTNNT